MTIQESNKKITCEFYNWFTSDETYPEVEKCLQSLNVSEDVLSQSYDYWLANIFTPDTI